MSTVLFDKTIERGILFLLIFTPLAMGTTRDWSIAVMECAILVVFAAWVVKRLAGLEDPSTAFLQLRGLAMAAVLIIALVLLQVVPLPFRLVSLLSPRTAELYRSMLDDPAASWRTLSIYPYATLTELAKLLTYGALFIVVFHHYATEERIFRLFRSIIYMACFLAVLAILGKMFDNGRLLWVIPSKATWTATGPYVNKNHFAGYMEMAIPLALAYYLYTARALSPLGAAQEGRLKQAASFLDNRSILPFSLGMTAVLLLTCALFMTLSRGGIIGFSVSMILFMLMVKLRRSLRNKARFMALIAGLMVFAVVFAGWGIFEARFEAARDQGTMRMSIWKDGLALAREYRLLGTGLGTFEKVFPLYQKNYPDTYFLHAENEYVEVLTDTGVAGLAVLIAMMFLYYRAVMKRWLERHNPFVVTMALGGIAACAAITTHSLTDFNMRVPANALLLTVVASLTAAGVFQVPSKKGRKQA